jgi:hypothetical protein
MGRTQGSSNRITSEIREKIQIILENEFETIEDTLNQLTPKERMEVVLRLLKFAIPQLKEVAIQDQRPPIEEIKVNIIK